MKFLFLKRSLSWPLATGHDVHTFHMMKALAALGHSVDLATVTPAIAGLPLDCVLSLASGGRDASPSAHLTWLQRRYLRYWGIDCAWIDAAAAITADIQPDVVAAIGLEMLPCLAAVRGAVRVWYAADEYARHHLSMLKATEPQTWRQLPEAAIAAVYERAFAPHIDRIWVVSESEQRAMRLASGVHAVDVVPNGVDGESFAPGCETRIPHSCAFWGRLDATPNIQAVEWFAKTVWPAVRREFPDARFTVFGFNPTDIVKMWDGKQGISVVGNLPDLRPELRRHKVAMMPFVSGGGIKNKLLEAAALGMPIVCSPLACGGLNPAQSLPLTVARMTGDWLAALRTLWGNEETRQRQGSANRRWVLEYHSWEAAARAAVGPIGAICRREQRVESEVSS